MINILIAEDRKIVLDAFQSLLANEEDIRVIAIARNGKEAIELIHAQPEINLAILDIEMPKMTGIEVTEYLKENNPNIKVLILSAYMQIQYIQELFRIGADGYLLKDTDREELLFAIREISNDGIYFGKEITDKELKHRLGRNKSNRPKLTPREEEILKLIANDHSTLEIADMLSIAPSTVETHRKHLLRKTKVKSSLGLVKFAYENKYL